MTLSTPARRDDIVGVWAVGRVTDARQSLFGPKIP